jgi:PhnB protein
MSTSIISTTIMPFLVVKGGVEALAFYTTALGATVVERDDMPDGTLMAKLMIGDAAFCIGDEEVEYGNRSPQTIGGSPVRIVLITADPDAVFANALQAGATQICPVTTEDTWRIGKLSDPFGHIWEIGHPLND